MTLRSSSFALACRVLALTLALFVSAPLHAQTNAAGEEYAAVMQRGQDLLNSGDFEGAIEAFTQGLTLTQQQSGEAYLGRAMARKQLQDYTKAQEDLKNLEQYAINRDPKLSAAAKNLSGEINLDLGDAGSAMADFEEAVGLDSKNAEYQFNLGKIYTMVGNPGGRKLLTKWIDAGVDDPEKNAEAHRLRALSFAQGSRFEEANADIEQALKINPDDFQIYSLQGTILGIQGEYQKAAAAYETAIQKYQPEEGSDLPYIEGHLQRAAMLEESAKKADDPDQRRDLFQAMLDETQKLLDALPDRGEMAAAKASTLYSRGVAQRQLGDLAAAVRSFSEAIDINPSMAQAYFRRGICFFHMGEERMAIADFDKAGSIDFESPHAAQWKGRTYAQLGEFYEALKAYGEALSVSDRYTDAYVNRGLVYVKLGEYQRAIADFDDAIRLQPTNGQHYYFRGVAYALAGEHERAIRSLATAIDFDDSLAGAYLKLAEELDAIGRPDVATKYRARGNDLSNHVNK